MAPGVFSDWAAHGANCASLGHDTAGRMLSGAETRQQVVIVHSREYDYSRHYAITFWPQSRAHAEARGKLLDAGHRT